MASKTAPQRHGICCIPDDSSHTSKMYVKSGSHGLHAMASQDMNAGTTIVQCLPLSHSLLVPPGMSIADDIDNGDKKRRCARCFFQEGSAGSTGDRWAKLRRCSKCKVAYYCSRSCQAEDWNTQHKLECQYYVKRRNNSSDSMVATSPEEDAIPLLLRTFAALKHLHNRDSVNPDDNCCLLQHDNIDNSDDDVHENGIVSCGRKHFSSLATSPEYRLESALPTECLSNSFAMRLAKDCMTSFAPTKDGKQSGDADAVEVWGYNRNISGEYGAETSISLDHSIQRTLNAFQKNNFGIVDSLHASIGEGVYPCAAFLNHSCHPNCILRYDLGIPYRETPTMYHPPILQIVACRDIKAGDELAHSYVDLALPTPERQSRLLQTHGFECRCKRCLDECSIPLPRSIGDWKLWSLEQKMKSLQGNSEQSITREGSVVVGVSLDKAMSGQGNLQNSMEYKHLIQQSEYLQEQATHCMLEGDSEGELTHLHRAIELFQGFGYGISPFHFQLYSIRCAYLSALLASGDYLGAVDQCEHIVSFLAVAFSHVQNHPLLGLQLYTLGDLYKAAGDSAAGNSSDLKAKAQLAYTWAKDVMAITHGRHNFMVRSLEENICRS